MPAEPRGSLGNYVDRLLSAIDAGEVELRFNIIGLNTPGRRSYSAFDNGLVSFGPLICAGINYYFYGWIPGLISLLCGLAFSLMFGRPWVFKRTKDRAMLQLMADESFMLDLWRDELCMLTHIPSGAEARPPEDDWRVFVRDHLLIGR